MKNNTKNFLFEMMEKVNPNFKSPINEQQTTTMPTATAQQQPDVVYANNAYKTIAPTLKLINTIDKFEPAFKGWFSYLGYSPQDGNISITRIRTDVEKVMRELGYK